MSITEENALVATYRLLARSVNQPDGTPTTLFSLHETVLDNTGKVWGVKPSPVVVAISRDALIEAATIILDDATSLLQESISGYVHNMADFPESGAIKPDCFKLDPLGKSSPIG